MFEAFLTPQKKAFKGNHQPILTDNATNSKLVIVIYLPIRLPIVKAWSGNEEWKENTLLRIIVAISGITILATLVMSGCQPILYYDGERLYFGKPSYERRDLSVENIDLLVLNSAIALLPNENAWSRSDNRNCDLKDARSLFCVLYEAQMSKTGHYNHRMPAMQHVRFAIEDSFPNSWSKHRLADFNSNPSTEFEDIVTVLKTARDHVATKLNGS